MYSSFYFTKRNDTIYVFGEIHKVCLTPMMVFEQRIQDLLTLHFVPGYSVVFLNGVVIQRWWES